MRLSMFWLLVISVSCATTEQRDTVAVTVSNKTSGKLKMMLIPQFSLPGRPGSENVRTVELASGQSQALELLRGKYLVQSRPDDVLAHPQHNNGEPGEGYGDDEIEIHANGEILIDKIRLRWLPAESREAPERPVRWMNDPSDKREGLR
jgi:hypothetical protein